MLTAELAQELLNYDPETGEFTWRVDAGRWGRIKAGAKAGSAPHGDGYLDLKVRGGLYKLHRLAWLYMTGEWPKDQLDHINGNRADNRFCNLRPATLAENAQNRKLNANSTSGYRGVSWHKGQAKWAARISNGGARVTLGYFATPESAAQAYVAAKAARHKFNPLARS